MNTYDITECGQGINEEFDEREQMAAWDKQTEKESKDSMKPYEFLFNLRHWLFGINWGVETILEAKWLFVVVHFGPWSLIRTKALDSPAPKEQD